MKRLFQYLGDSHTYIRLSAGAEKVKVGHGEIVESDLDPKLFTTNTFQDVTEFGTDIKPAALKEGGGNDAQGAGAHVPSIEDFTKKQLVAIAGKYKLELDGLTDKDTADKLRAKLSPQMTQEVIEAEYALIAK